MYLKQNYYKLHNQKSINSRKVLAESEKEGKSGEGDENENERRFMIAKIYEQTCQYRTGQEGSVKRGGLRLKNYATVDLVCLMWHRSVAEMKAAGFDYSSSCRCMSSSLNNVLNVCR